MGHRKVFIVPLLIVMLGGNTILGFGQQVKDVIESFEALSSKPEIIFLQNDLKIPSRKGHFQGVQLIKKNGTEKLLISGSSLTTAYILQADLATKKTEQLIKLMDAPFRHAGGIQVSKQYLVVGIEDNFTKTASKLCLYNYDDGSLYKARSSMTISREGEPKKQTAGSMGILALESEYLTVASNWDSRNWDFYLLNLQENIQKTLGSFSAPDNWASYQSINLLKDKEAIYAIGFYQNESVAYADLILVSKLKTFDLIMEKVHTKAFNCKEGVDFGGAAGLQVDNEGLLHIWGTQKDPMKQIVINKFSQKK